MTAVNLCLADAFLACDIDAAIINGQESRIAAEKFALLLQSCNDKLNRHDIATLIARQFRPGVFHALGYLVGFSTVGNFNRLLTLDTGNSW